MGNVLRLALFRRRYSTLAWAGGMVALALLTLAVYPVLRENPEVDRLLRSLPQGMLKMFGIEPDLFLTGVGYVEAQLYSMMAPLVLSAMTILIGAAATAVEEQRGTADLLLAQPLRRTHVVLGNFIAMALLATGTTLALGGTLALGNDAYRLALTARGLFGINLGLWLLSLFFGTLTLAVGAWSGRPSIAMGVAGGGALLAFFWYGIAQVFEPLLGLAWLSPFHWYLHDHPAWSGPTVGHAWLGGATLALLGCACVAFARRDLGTTATLLPRRKRPRRSHAALRAPRLLQSVFGRELWLRRITILWWMLALYGMAVAIIAFWPTLRESPVDIEALLKAVPDELFAMFGISDPKIMFRPEGFLSSRLYATMGPILLIAFSIGAGTSAIAGEESRGTLGILVAQPIPRARVVRDKFLALALWTTLLPLGLGFVLLLGDWAVGLHLPIQGILSANVGLALVSLLFGALAFAVGCATGRPVLARGIATTVAIAAFLLNGLASYLGVFAPVRALSPFAWLLQDGPPLARGLSPSMLAAPAVIVALYLWAVRSFGRRDLAR